MSNTTLTLKSLNAMLAETADRLSIRMDTLEARVTTLESVVADIEAKKASIPKRSSNAQTASKPSHTASTKRSKKDRPQWTEAQMSAYKANIGQYTKKYYDGLHAVLKANGLLLTPKHCGRIFYNGEDITLADGSVLHLGSFYSWKGYISLCESINAMK